MTMQRPLLLLLALSMAACGETTEPELFTQTKVPGVSMREIGPGNRQLELIDAVLLDPEAGLDARVVQTTAQHGDALAAVFQVSTGETSYIRMTEASGARAITRLDDDIFIGTYLEGQLFRWRDGMSEPERIQIPRPNDERYEFVFSIERGSDGAIYVGTWPEGDLLRYREESGTIENLGPMVDDPPHEYYLRHVNAAFDGRLFLSFGTEVALIDYDLDSGESRDILPDAFRDRTWVALSNRFRDLLVTLVDPDGALIFQNPESAEVDRIAKIPDGQRVWPHNYNSLQVHGDHIYFGTIEDDALRRYHYDSDAFEVVGEGLGHPIGIAAERYLFCVGRLGLYSVVDLESGEVVLQRQSDFVGDGMLIHAISPGPSGTLVGGTYINQGFFVYDPISDEMFSPGRSVEFPGQIDNLTTLGERVFIGHYTKGRFSVYDFKEDWSPGYEPTSNPRFLGSAYNNQDRVPNGTVGPDNNVYFGTKPEYGMLGGSIVRIDPETDSLTVFRDVIEGQSIYALASDGDRHLFGSSSVRGGLGARPSHPTSVLFKWDVRSDSLVWQKPIVENTYEMWDLDWVEPGVLVGAVDSSLFLFDVESEETIALAKVAPEIVKNVVASSDGWIYAMTEERLVRASRDLATVEELDVDSGYWDSMAELDNGRLFVGRGEILYEVVR